MIPARSDATITTLIASVAPAPATAPMAAPRTSVSGASDVVTARAFAFRELKSEGAKHVQQHDNAMHEPHDTREWVGRRGRIGVEWPQFDGHLRWPSRQHN